MDSEGIFLVLLVDIWLSSANVAYFTFKTTPFIEYILKNPS